MKLHLLLLWVAVLACVAAYPFNATAAEGGTTARLLQDPRMPSGRTTEDFKKWAAAEFKRRAAVYAALKKVKDGKSVLKCEKFIKKVYRYDQVGGREQRDPLSDYSYYHGSTDEVDPAVLEAVKKKFSKQFDLLLKEQGRLMHESYLVDDSTSVVNTIIFFIADLTRIGVNIDLRP